MSATNTACGSARPPITTAHLEAVRLLEQEVAHRPDAQWMRIGLLQQLNGAHGERAAVRELSRRGRREA